MRRPLVLSVCECEREETKTFVLYRVGGNGLTITGLGYPQSRDVARVLIWNARRKQLGFREEKVSIDSLKPRRFSLGITIIYFIWAYRVM